MESEVLSYRNVSTREIFDNPDEFLNDILDAILLKYEKEPFPIPREVVISQKGIQLNSRDAHIVIMKLCKDGYVDEINVNGLIQYYITFEGVKFLSEGGYVTAYQNDQKQSRIKKMNEKLLIVGSWLAGIGAMLLFLVELLKHFGWVLSINLLTVCFVFGSGFLIGICILLILSELKSK